MHSKRLLDKVDVSPLTAVADSAVVTIRGTMTATGATFTECKNFDLVQIYAGSEFVDTLAMEDPIHRHYFPLRR
jgi:hypothetical protein